MADATTSAGPSAAAAAVAEETTVADHSRSSLAAVPPSVLRLSRLLSLDLSSNRLSALPAELPTALPAGRVASTTPGAAPSGVGGASTDDPRDTVLLTPLPLPCGSLVPRVVCPTAGAVATFTGTTRETFEGRAVVRLEYEAYEAMARKEMLALCAAVRARWPVRHIAIAHRTGTERPPLGPWAGS